MSQHNVPFSCSCIYHSRSQRRHAILGTPASKLGSSLWLDICSRSVNAPSRWYSRVIVDPVIGARTGGQNDLHAVDNLSIIDDTVIRHYITNGHCSMSGFLYGSGFDTPAQTTGEDIGCIGGCTFSSFSMTGLTLYGNAQASGDGWLRLTSTATSQQGAMFLSSCPPTRGSCFMSDCAGSAHVFQPSAIVSSFEATFRFSYVIPRRQKQVLLTSRVESVAVREQMGCRPVTEASRLHPGERLLVLPIRPAYSF
jgi:hypothetical protein